MARGLKIKETNVEPESSRIEWEKADPITAKKLAGALKKNSAPAWLVNLLLSFPTAFLLYFLVACVIMASKSSFPEIIALCILGIFPACLFLGILAYKYLEMRPYLYPEKQAELWIFRTKCSRVAISGSRHSSRTQDYFAYFNSKAGKISIRIPYKEYNLNPVGKEYIFFKFKNQTGKRWTNIAAEKLDEISID